MEALVKLCLYGRGERGGQKTKMLSPNPAQPPLIIQPFLGAPLLTLNIHTPPAHAPPPL
jgi:hypothetical protein